jgi:hypothetical protein
LKPKCKSYERIKKTEKEKRNEKGKRVKGCGDTIWPGIRRIPGPSRKQS